MKVVKAEQAHFMMRGFSYVMTGVFAVGVVCVVVKSVGLLFGA